MVQLLVERLTSAANVGTDIGVGNVSLPQLLLDMEDLLSNTATKRNAKVGIRPVV